MHRSGIGPFIQVLLSSISTFNSTSPLRALSINRPDLYHCLQQLNEYLHFTATKKVRVACFKHVLSMVNIQAPVANAPQPAEPDVYYFGSNNLLPEQRVHKHIIHCFASLAITAIQGSQKEQEDNMLNSGHVFVESKDVPFEELPDDNGSMDADFLYF